MEKMYTVKEAAQELNITTYTVRRYLREGIINGTKYVNTDKGNWYIQESELEKLRTLRASLKDTMRTE